MSESSTASTPARYAGDVPPADVFDALRRDPEAVLVDCRTRAEWQYVGTPYLGDLEADLVLLEWQSYPEGRVDPAFVDRLLELGISRDRPVYFLCRSGVRSKAAAIAATDAGFDAAYNVASGFEGPLGPDGKRNVDGWKVVGLPWRQS